MRFLLLLSVAALIASPISAQGNAELAGGWVLTSWESPDGDVLSAPQPGLFMFTASGVYSIMYVNGDQPRAVQAGDLETDAEKLDAYDSFTANSGRYSVEGNAITYEAYMAKNPGYMSRFGPDGGNASTMNYSIENDILTLRFLTGNAQGATAKFRRPNQN